MEHGGMDMGMDMGMDSACVFCKIAAGEIPSKKLFEDEHVIVINDIHPAAKTHLLVIPKRHYSDILALDDAGLAWKIHGAIQRAARDAGITRGGFRVINNCGADGGQTVPHLHYHILGGESLGPRLL